MILVFLKYSGTPLIRAVWDQEVPVSLKLPVTSKATPNYRIGPYLVTYCNCRLGNLKIRCNNSLRLACLQLHYDF